MVKRKWKFYSKINLSSWLIDPFILQLISLGLHSAAAKILKLLVNGKCNATNFKESEVLGIHHDLIEYYYST